METDENSSGALGAGENGGGSHRLQSPGSVRRPLVEIFTSKSDCTGNCNRSNCGFLFDDRLHYFDANMLCVPVENVPLRRGGREGKWKSKGEEQINKKSRPAAAEENKENSAAAASMLVLGESGSGKTLTTISTLAISPTPLRGSELLASGGESNGLRR